MDPKAGTARQLGFVRYDTTTNSMDPQSSRRLLIEILQLAYSGELAASFAYQGHWKSVGNLEEKNRIRTIEEEEWHHRKLVGEMLRDLGEHPSSWREFKAVIIGRTAGFLCHVTGWLAPMYGAASSKVGMSGNMKLLPDTPGTMVAL